LIGPALELGRSFIRPEYQRQFRAAAAVVERDRALRGAQAGLPDAVRGGQREQRLQPRLPRAAGEFSQRHTDAGLAPLVSPSGVPSGLFKQWQAHVLSRFLKDLEDLADPIADLNRMARAFPSWSAGT